MDRVHASRPTIIVSSLGLALAGAALFASLVAASLGAADGFGGFLLDGLSWAAYALPAYPWLGAVIIAMPGFRYDLLIGLLLSLFPFASLSATARFLDDPTRALASFPALEPLGILGVAVAGLCLTLGSGALACLAVARARSVALGAAESEPEGLADDRPAPAVPPASRRVGARAEREAAREADRAARAAAKAAPEPPADTADDDFETRTFDLSYPDLPPVPFLASMTAPEPAPEAADSGMADPSLDDKPAPVGHDGASGDDGAAGDDEPELLVDLDDAHPEADEPIPLMFGRPEPRDDVRADLVASDPALDADFWADAGLVDAEPAADDPAADELAAEEPAAADRRAHDAPDDRRPSLLPRVEVFQDGEHAEALRTNGEARRDFDPAAVTPAATLVKAARPVPEESSTPPAKPAAAPPEGEPAAAKPRLPGRKPVVAYSMPTEGILTDYPDGQYWIIDDKTRKAAEVLRETLQEFGIEAEVTGIRKGPVITMFEILPAPGVRLSKIANLCDNIALRLAASSVRIVAPIPGKHAVGIEVPNERRAIVSFKEIVESETFKNAKMEVPVVLGKDITGDVQVVELTHTPHLLIAGATGSGKSVCVNSIILSILYRRSFNEVKLILIDPKIVELKLYNGIPHLLTPVITEPKRAFQALQYCICEMERRYSLLDAMGVRDIKSYNKKIVEKSMATDKLPYIVVIIDEFADLMATTGKELESTLARLAAMSRAVGIHLVLATQRPSIDVITGLIKANIPSRIAFMVAGKFDSRIIIDMVGAEKLLGRGDMLFSGSTDAFPVRMQGAFVSDDEVERVVAHVKTLGEPDYIDEEIFVDDDDDEGPSLFDDEDDDPLYEKALEIVLSQGKASASFLQRKLKIGYNRAARIVELMEEKGIVGKAQGSKPRDLVHNPDLGSRPPNPRARYVPDFSADDDDDDGEADADPGEGDDPSDD